MKLWRTSGVLRRFFRGRGTSRRSESAWAREAAEAIIASAERDTGRPMLAHDVRLAAKALRDRVIALLQIAREREDHPSRCLSAECELCSLRDCPSLAPEHYRQGGCRTCTPGS